MLRVDPGGHGLKHARRMGRPEAGKHDCLTYAEWACYGLAESARPGLVEPHNRRCLVLQAVEAVRIAEAYQRDIRRSPS
jgi:hypothetical protein